MEKKRPAFQSLVEDERAFEKFIETQSGYVCSGNKEKLNKKHREIFSVFLSISKDYFRTVWYGFPTELSFFFAPSIEFKIEWECVQTDCGQEAVGRPHMTFSIFIEKKNIEIQNLHSLFFYFA